MIKMDLKKNTDSFVFAYLYKLWKIYGALLYKHNNLIKDNFIFKSDSDLSEIIKYSYILNNVLKGIDSSDLAIPPALAMIKQNFDEAIQEKPKNEFLLEMINLVFSMVLVFRMVIISTDSQNKFVFFTKNENDYLYKANVKTLKSIVDDINNNVIKEGLSTQIGIFEAICESDLALSGQSNSGCLSIALIIIIVSAILIF
jgi:hypothetical protein